MNTLIISSSVSDQSKSLILCNKMKDLIQETGVSVEVIDAKLLELNLFHKGMTTDMEELAYKITHADNIIIGMGVHNYSINDGLKLILDSCFTGATGKFFGILCAAGGDKSYLSTGHLTQICMNQWRMLQLPRVVYVVGKDFKNGSLTSIDALERMETFRDEFVSIGNKLLA